MAMDALSKCRACDAVPEVVIRNSTSGGTYYRTVHPCDTPLCETEESARTEWNAANAAPDPALLALAKFGAMVLDWSPLECGFPTIPGGVIDDMAVRSGCALEDASDGGHECWTAPDVRLAIAALLAPDAPDGAGEATDG